MASKTGPDTDGLIRRLKAEPFRFDFFHAVRLLEGAFRDRAPVGHSRHPAEDPVRFGQNPSLAFAPGAVAAFATGEGDREDVGAGRLFVNCFGLLGPNGPMPFRLTEHVRNRARHHRDIALARFLDVFHHRMLSLFYRAWAANHQTVSYDRAETDRFAVYIGSLFGIGMPSLRDRDAVPDAAKLHYSGRLVCQTRHAEGLRAILGDYFCVPSEIEQFVGQWLGLATEYRWRLGDSRETGTVGAIAILGEHIWDCRQKFRVTFGPMGFDEYQRLLPGGDSFRRIVTWIRNYCGDALSWDLRLILRAAEVPALRLGQVGRLGWSTWLGGMPFSEDADDCVLRPTSGYWVGFRIQGLGD